MVNMFMLFLECSVTMALIAALFQVLTPLLSKRYTARTMYYGWLVMMIGFIVPFRPRLDFGLIPTPTAIQQASSSSGFSPLLIAAVIWISGVVAVFAYQLFMHYRFTKAVNRWGEKLKTPKILAILENEQKETGVVAEVSVYQCQFITSPLLLGLRKPKILLPDMELSQDELSMIIRHELIHFRRKDILAKFIILLATALHWYNPVIWFSSKAISLQCEISCDTETMLNTDVEQRQQYSETLIGVIRQAKPQTALATNFYCSKQSLKSRILSVMDTHVKNFGTALVVVLTILTLGTGMAFARDTAIAPSNGGDTGGGQQNTIIEEQHELIINYE